MSPSELRSLEAYAVLCATLVDVLNADEMVVIGPTTPRGKEVAEVEKVAARV